MIKYTKTITLTSRSTPTQNIRELPLSLSSLVLSSNIMILISLGYNILNMLRSDLSIMKVMAACLIMEMKLLHSGGKELLLNMKTSKVSLLL